MGEKNTTQPTDRSFTFSSFLLMAKKNEKKGKSSKRTLKYKATHRQRNKRERDMKHDTWSYIICPWNAWQLRELETEHTMFFAGCLRGNRAGTPPRLCRARGPGPACEPAGSAEARTVSWTQTSMCLAGVCIILTPSVHGQWSVTKHKRKTRQMWLWTRSVYKNDLRARMILKE